MNGQDVADGVLAGELDLEVVVGRKRIGTECPRVYDPSEQPCLSRCPEVQEKGLTAASW
jgi:hypothetical protein